jgi:hypothetical protein
VLTDAERDPVEWAQHSALVAISVARTVLDLVEAAVADRERLERLATSGRSFAESWLGDATRLATTVASGFGFEPDPKPAAAPASGPSGPVPGQRPATKPEAARASAPSVAKRPAKKATTRPVAKPAKAAKKKVVKGRTASPPRKK